MRILAACSSFRVYGAETVTLSMLKEFKRRGHIALAATSIWTDGEFSRRLGELGIPEQPMGFGAFAFPKNLRQIWWSCKTLVRLPALWLAWARALHDFAPDITLFGSAKMALLVYPLLRRKVTWVFEHNAVTPSRSNRLMYRLLVERGMNFIAVSEFVGAHLVALGVPEHTIRTVHNGVYSVASEHFQVAAPSRTAEDIVRFGIVGQISPHKGHECLMAATQMLRNQNIRFEIQVFGEGDPEYVAQIKTEARKTQIADSWKWRGYEADPRKIYGSFDVCLMPSQIDESFGMAAVEASAFGLPVVASRRGGLPEVVCDTVTGFLVPAESADTLAERMRWFVDHPTESRAMGAAGRSHAMKRFTVERMVDVLEQTFADSIQRRAQAS